MISVRRLHGAERRARKQGGEPPMRDVGRVGPCLHQPPTIRGVTQKDRLAWRYAVQPDRRATDQRERVAGTGDGLERAWVGLRAGLDVEARAARGGEQDHASQHAADGVVDIARHQQSQSVTWLDFRRRPVAEVP